MTTKKDTPEIIDSHMAVYAQRDELRDAVMVLKTDAIVLDYIRKTEKQMLAYKLDYRGYTIEVKRDFGNSFFLVDGMPCNFGYLIVKDGCNACPGAGWFQTVEQAKLGVDCLIEAGEDSDKFHALYMVVRKAQTAGPELLKALQEIIRNDPYNQSSAGIIARDAAKLVDA